MPYLHNAVLKMPPVAQQPAPEDATINLNVIGIVLATLVGLIVMVYAYIIPSAIP